MEQNTGRTVQSDSEGIQLDPSVLQEQGETYSSLTDTNQIPLFTNNFEEMQEKKQKRDEEIVRTVKTALFQNEKEHGLNEYERIQNSLFMNTEIQLKKEEIKEESNQVGTAVAAVGILLIIFFMFAFSWMEKRRKRRRKDAIDTYIYE